MGKELLDVPNFQVEGLPGGIMGIGSYISGSKINFSLWAPTGG